jgi:hypothetical protein
MSRKTLLNCCFYMFLFGIERQFGLCTLYSVQSQQGAGIHDSAETTVISEQAAFLRHAFQGYSRLTFL